MDKELEKKYEQLCYEYAKMFEELIITQNKLAELQGLDDNSPVDELENNLNDINAINENNTEPIFFKSKLDLSYSEKIKSNIANIIESNIPTYLKDKNERAKYREDLIREWADSIVAVTGHVRRTAQEVLKGNKYIDAETILIMEDVIPLIDRDDILGKRKNKNVAEYELVLEKLRKEMAKNRILAAEIEKIINALIRNLNKIDEKNIGDVSSFILPYIERRFEQFINKAR